MLCQLENCSSRRKLFYGAKKFIGYRSLPSLDSSSPFSERIRIHLFIRYPRFDTIVKNVRGGGLVKSGEIVTRMENRLVKKAAKRREARGHRGGATPAPPTSIL